MFIARKRGELLQIKNDSGKLQISFSFWSKILFFMKWMCDLWEMLIETLFSCLFTYVPRSEQTGRCKSSDHTFFLYNDKKYSVFCILIHTQNVGLTRPTSNPSTPMLCILLCEYLSCPCIPFFIFFHAFFSCYSIFYCFS